MTEKLTITVKELAEQLGVGIAVAYELVKKEGFPAIRVSERRIIVPVDALHKWLETEAFTADVGRL